MTSAERAELAVGGAHAAEALRLRRGIALVLASAVSFGAMAVLIKLAYREGLNARTLLALRFSIATSGMWLIWLLQRARGLRVPNLRSKVPALVALGALGYVGQSFSYFTAVSIIPASATGLLLYTYPVLVTLLAWVFYREQLTPRKIAALLMASLGALMVLGLVSEALQPGGSSTLASLKPEGVFWGLASAAIYSAYIIAGTRFAAGVPPIFSSAVITLSAAVVYIVWGLAAHDLDFSFSPLGWLWAALIALVCTIIAIATFFAGLSLVGPSRASIVSTLEPAVTVLLAALVLGERITPEQFAGGALILGAVVVLQAGRRRRA
jgi:drug/metabolite transporter (DMT)-like permease